ncbi:replication initiator [Herbiconiux sp. 11R-BC]|uniref:replication initiator n=1 Tax=Herbiconiux sp. 11R-BC TaxID=3111637 RepID=UPI003C0A43B6
MQTSAESATNRMQRPDFGEWLKQAAGTNYCANPVRLVGSSVVVDASSGEVISFYESSREPDGVTYVRCGNRRAVRCPSCSHEYKGDMWHLVVAGAAGGSKDVPAAVGTHPLIFVTLTAPSFGAVHAVKKAGRSGSVRCRPRSKKELCPHGKPTWCMRVHPEGSPTGGEPLCRECYDYLGHIVWQWHAPELWRRFTIAFRRQLAQSLGLSESASKKFVRVQFAKVAEFQKRGLVHFHALIRLDGDPSDDRPFPPPALNVTAEQLAAIARSSAAQVWTTAAPVFANDETRSLRFGRQCDARVVVRGGIDEEGELSDRAVAAYIAKYATKATEDVDPDASANGPRPHIAQLRQTVEDLAAVIRMSPGESPYELLGKWVGMLGFRGHFATKSRRYSTTLGRIRSARRTWQRRAAVARTRGPGDFDEAFDDLDESTLIISQWSFTGMGWLTSGDAYLAAQAAAAAREWADEKRHESRTAHKKKR